MDGRGEDAENEELPEKECVWGCGVTPKSLKFDKNAGEMWGM
jgi:hypothetical protein